MRRTNKLCGTDSGKDGSGSALRRGKCPLKVLKICDHAPDIKRTENRKHLCFYHHNTLKTFALSLFIYLFFSFVLLFVVAMSPGSVLVNSGRTGSTQWHWGAYDPLKVLVWLLIDTISWAHWLKRVSTFLRSVSQNL